MRYTVEYKMYGADDVNRAEVTAQSKAEAYDKVVYEHLDQMPYSAWVASVTYKNGKVKRFNTYEGKRY